MPEKIRKRIKTRLRKILGIPPPPKAPEKVPYDDTYDKARAAGIDLRQNGDAYDFIKGKRMIRLGARHKIYLLDIVSMFDFYFDSVHPIEFGDYLLVDFSTPKYHEVVGYDRHPVMFPSFSEPVFTTQHYLGFADLKPGAVAIDLGGYSGLTSILFRDIVGKDGRIVVVEADKQNVYAMTKNLRLYESITQNKIEALAGAAWNHDNGLEFSSEGNMGASTVSIVGNRAKTEFIPSYTLHTIAKKFDLEKIDFIKCDIEGGEMAVFEDAEFFRHYKPRIIVEPHFIEGKLTSEKVTSDLAKYGYTFKTIDQPGVTEAIGLPLIECYPPATDSASLSQRDN